MEAQVCRLNKSVTTSERRFVRPKYKMLLQDWIGPKKRSRAEWKSFIICTVTFNQVVVY